MQQWPNKKYLTYIGGLLAAIIILPAVGYFLYKNVLPAGSPQIGTGGQGVDLVPARVALKEPSAPIRPFDFNGTLYLALRKIDGNFDLGIYAFNINGIVGSRFTTIFADRIAADGNYYISLSPSVSSDGKKLVFSRGKVSEQLFQIFTSDLSGGNLRQITSTPDKYKREPVFNAAGNLIAYISHNTKSSANDPDPEIPENWSTYLTNLEGNVVKVFNGVNPIFSPDGTKLLILENDGLHAFDITEWTKPKPLGLVVGTVGGRASQTMKIAVSSDGSMMAWPSIKAGELVVSRITDWDKFALSPLLVIKTKAYWSAFSPDGKYLAVDEWRKDASGNEYPIIMGYDLSNGASEKIVTLESDDKAFLWLGSWK